MFNELGGAHASSCMLSTVYSHSFFGHGLFLKVLTAIKLFLFIIVTTDVEAIDKRSQIITVGK